MGGDAFGGPVADAGPATFTGYYPLPLQPGMTLGELARLFNDRLHIGAALDVVPMANYVRAMRFDDTGLEAARCLAPGPVIGIGEAAYHVASLIAGKFSVVTTLSRSIPAIEHNLVRYGLISRCARVRAADVEVLELEDPNSPACERISLEIARAVAEDNAEAIVLGCAGMADLAAQLSREHGLPVVDGVAAAVKLAEGLVGLGLKTSKRGGYAPPLVKRYEGIFAAAAPQG